MVGNSLFQISTSPMVFFSSLTTLPSSSSRFCPHSFVASTALTPTAFQLSSCLKALQSTHLIPISNNHACPLKRLNESLGTIRGNPCLFRTFVLPLLLGNGDSCYQFGSGSGGSGNDNHDRSNSDSGWHDDDGSSGSYHPFFFFSIFVCSIVCCFCNFQLASALAMTAIGASDKSESGHVWEVRGGKWTMLIPHLFEDAYIIAPGRGTSFSSPSSFSLSYFWLQCRHVFMRMMLPEGFPQSVSSDYLDYSLWRGVQGIASQISGVLATQVCSHLSVYFSAAKIISL